jgi:hypothetical protein
MDKKLKYGIIITTVIGTLVMIILLSIYLNKPTTSNQPPKVIQQETLHETPYVIQQEIPYETIEENNEEYNEEYNEVYNKGYNGENEEDELLLPSDYTSLPVDIPFVPSNPLCYKELPKADPSTTVSSNNTNLLQGDVEILPSDNGEYGNAQYNMFCSNEQDGKYPVLSKKISLYKFNNQNTYNDANILYQRTIDDATGKYKDICYDKTTGQPMAVILERLPRNPGTGGEFNKSSGYYLFRDNKNNFCYNLKEPLNTSKLSFTDKASFYDTK